LSSSRPRLIDAATERSNTSRKRRPFASSPFKRSGEKSPTCFRHGLIVGGSGTPDRSSRAPWTRKRTAWPTSASKPMLGSSLNRIGALFTSASIS
jgi:hypothetical protein